MAQQATAAARPRPAVFTFGAWMNRLWDQIPLNSEYQRPVLLAAAQEQALWQTIISASRWSGVLMQTSSLARTAQQAHRLMVEWLIPFSRLHEFSHDEARAFLDWSQMFAERCKRGGWVEACRLPELLMALPDGFVDWPKQIYTFGLQRTTALQQVFLNYLATQGCKISVLELPARNERRLRVAAASPQQEFEAAASWAWNTLQQHPRDTIAIGLTDFERQGLSLRQSLDRVFAPQPLMGSVDTARPRYDMAQTQSLIDHPAIECAMRILSQSRHRIDLQELSRLLRSAWIAGAEQELSTRSLLDAYLQQRGELKPSLTFILSHITGASTEPRDNTFDCPQLMQHLGKWRRAIDQLPPRQAPSAWANSVSKLLDAMGWPGERSLMAREYDVINAWDDVLSQLSVLDMVVGEIAFDELLRWLRNLVTETRLPSPPTAAHLQVVRIEDAARIPFDHLWVCGIDDEQWPPPARPNALLPVVLQREYELPMASHESIQKVAAEVSRGLTENARNLVLSYAQMDGDRERRPSPLFADIEIKPANDVALPLESPAAQIFALARRERIADVSLPLSEGSASGGTSIIKNQAACPFRAYVIHRLDAALPEEPEVGLDASERGMLLHNVLEIVWSKLGSHAALLQADEGTREQFVSEAADTALQTMVWKKPETLTPKFRELERERLITQTMAWLHFEEQRSAFTVLKPEAERYIDLAGLRIHMRVDRIDETSDGARIMLDYKTGEPSTSGWFGERPDEPQLPLYALTEIDAGHEVAAVSFAQVRPGDVAFKGISQSADQLPGVAAVEKHRQGRQYANWSALVDDWRQVLQSLAAEFVAGDARVDPKNNSSCQFCELEGVCRIQELESRLGRLSFEDEADD